MRAFLHDRPSYVAAPADRRGDAGRRGRAGRRVAEPAVQSRATSCVGGFGWQDYAADGARRGVMKITGNHPLPDLPGVLGGIGLTAYFGLLESRRSPPGETVLISGAAGATGSTAVADCEAERLPDDRHRRRCRPSAAG